MTPKNKLLKCILMSGVKIHRTGVFIFFLVAEYVVAEIQIPLILNVNGFL